MAKATQRMPEFRETLLTLMRTDQLRRAFGEWDRNGDGTLSARELQVGLAQLAKVPEEDVQKVIDAGGVNAEGLSYVDFLQVVASLDASQRLAKRLGKQFRAQLHSHGETLASLAKQQEAIRREIAALHNGCALSSPAKRQRVGHASDARVVTEAD